MNKHEALLQAQLRQQEALTELGLLALSGADLRVVMDQAVQKLKEVLDVEYTKVLELLPGGKEVVLRAGVGWKPEIVVDKSTVDTGTDSQAGYTLLSQRPVVVKDLRTEKRFSGPPLLTDHRVVSGMSCVIWGKNDQPYGVLGIHTVKRRDFSSFDINFLQVVANTLAAAIQRKQDEDRLRESEMRNTAILESSMDAIITINQTGKVVDWNPAAERLFGFSREQAIGSEMAKLIIPERFREAHHQGIKHFLATGEGPVLGKLLETPALRADGTEFFSELTITHAIGEGTSVFSATMRDITKRKQAEEALQESEARFRATFDEAALPMAIVDLHGKWLSLNHVFHKVFGYSPEELKQMSFYDITHPDDRVSDREDVQKLLEGKINQLKKEKRYIHKSGAIVWGIVHLSIIKDIRGHSLYVVAAIQDITERKRAEEQLRYRGSLLKAQQEVSPLGVLVVSPEGNILTHNQRFVEMWKLSPEVVAEKRDDLALETVKDQLVDADRFVEVVRETYELQKVDVEKLFLKDGRIFNRFGSPVRSESGLNYGYVWFFQDITEQENLARLKDDFIGIASHELKTPVTSIKAYTQILVSRLKAGGDHVSAEMLTKMDIQIDKLTKLIVDLLDVTKIEHGKLQYEEESFDFNALLREKVEEVQRTSYSHEIIIKVDGKREIKGNRDRVGQVITNLLTNAVKFSREAAKIIIGTEIRDDELVCFVQDFGLGLSVEDQVKVFERFYRVGDGRFETYPGLGLGLFISSEIIHRHKGKIWVESETGKGSTFYFSLPLR